MIRVSWGGLGWVRSDTTSRDDWEDALYERGGVLSERGMCYEKDCGK